SGNGFQLFYPCELSAEKAVDRIINRLLTELARKFDSGGATVDTSVSNSARLCRVAGAWNCKGLAEPDRPYRLARLAEVPDHWDSELVTLDLVKAAIETLCPPAKEAKGAAQSSNFTATATGGDHVAKYVKSALERECTRVVMAPQGERNKSLNIAAFCL